MFANLKNLKILDLSWNKLSRINPQSFFGIENLKELSIGKNNLSNFDLAILENIPQIEIIDLRGNPIENKKEILHFFKDSKIKLHFI